MLIELHIQNLALIETLDLNFQQGFTTLTGETGAGKSILLDALGLTLGERADSSLVRHGAKRADVTAQFDLENLVAVQNWLTEQELELDEPHVTLRRTVTPEGRSKAYINGIPTGLSLVKELGKMLIDIHGQHEHQSLMNTSKQLELLDAYVNQPETLKTVREHYQVWQKLCKELIQAQALQDEYRSKLELLQFQFAELSDLAAEPNEYDILSEEHKQLSHASEIKQYGFQAYETLESEQGASNALQTAIHALENLIEYMPSVQEPLQQLNSALIDIQEAANSVQQMAETVELDPERLNTAEERLSELHAMAKKYQIEPNDLAEKLSRVSAELEQLNHSGERIESLKLDIEQAEKTYHRSAKVLTKIRQDAADKLAAQITTGMQELGMPNGEFAIKRQAHQASITGLDKIEFLVTANKGQPLQTMSKVASGGELSRISLAIQVATAEVTQLPTMIFDEVDVGIGGGIAEIVGQKLQALGQSKQILSITHLAQVACHGHQHLKIEKETLDEHTYTRVMILKASERTKELGRMMGGLELTDSTLGLASEMLEQAQQRIV